MKNIFVKALAGIMLTVGATSCGDKFLETDIYNGIDMDGALDNATNIAVALNGTYYRLCQYYFAGNYAMNFGDIISDITYWNGNTSHFNSIYTCNYLATDSYLSYIWQYGYKVVDNSARIIEACDELLPEATASEAAELQRYKAEAYALRAYAMFYMTNIFGHQVKVNGQDFSSEIGIVVVDKPVEPETNVSRSTVGECYAQILSDLDASISSFAAAKQSRSSILVFNPANVYGLMARVKLYLEDYAGAKAAATEALSLKKITTLAYTDMEKLESDDPEDQDEAFDAYMDLYSSEYSNNESLFALAIDQKTNWSANSCGTLYTTYSYSPSPYLLSLYAENDCRTSIIKWTNQKGNQYVDYGTTTPWFGGGKFGTGDFNGVEEGNPACQTNYLINAPEMFLIQAEADAKLGNITEAQKALLVVAHRNPAIETVSDLPSDAAGIMAFLKDERARELFQEGQRFWDLRRWGAKSDLYAYGAPTINFQIKEFDVSQVIFPIPESEINAGFGVEQTPNWAATRPQ